MKINPNSFLLTTTIIFTNRSDRYNRSRASANQFQIAEALTFSQFILLEKYKTFA